MEKELLLQILANQCVLYKKLEEIKQVLPPVPSGTVHSAVNYRNELYKEASSVKKLIKLAAESKEKK